MILNILIDTLVILIVVWLAFWALVFVALRLLGVL